jgi:tetratricopeptide (TPR) repeat protein
MKKFLVLAITLLTLKSFAQMSSDDWNKQAKSNIRLLPKYGHKQKTDTQKQLDEKFLKETMQQDQFKGNRTAASDYMIKLGFDYLYKGDLKTAMYRFNQAYLLDSTNIDIYWGYGAVYMSLGDYEQAQKQYQEGLSVRPTNTHLLTDYGTYFLAQYYALIPIDEKNAKTNLDSAIVYMNKSYQYDAKDQNTLFKLSICHWLKGDCTNAWKFYDECKKLGGEPITEEYTKDLEKKCPKK